MKRESTIKFISKRLLAIMAFIAVYLILACGGSAHAEEPFKGLVISPANNRIELKNGQVYTNQMNVQNKTDEDMNIIMSTGTYVIENNNYNSPNYSGTSKYSLMKDWIKLDQTKFTLTPGESRLVNYTITAPVNPPSGMQYATIFAETEPAKGETTGISATSRVGMVLSAYMVDGKTDDRSSIQNEKIAGYQPTSPLKASFTIKNEGNIGVDVQYYMTIKSAINGKDAYDSRDQHGESGDKGSVYPETTRNFSLGWDKVGVGFYNVELHIITNGRDHVTKQLVCTVPIWIIILIVIAIISLVAYAIINYRMAKEAKQGRSSKKSTKKSSKK